MVKETAGRNFMSIQCDAYYPFCANLRFIRNVGKNILLFYLMFEVNATSKMQYLYVDSVKHCLGTYGVSCI